uniref:hypothetical protein n=1 Tax=Shewanella putrefaciens TaxID=24 RepID=UPI000AF26801|nr:hypothetical protein [Shewanella putrefaciens]
MNILSHLQKATLTLVLASASFLALAEDTLLNVSYDPTREFYREYNQIFSQYWQKQGHKAPTIRQSHGGSARKLAQLLMD